MIELAIVIAFIGSFLAGILDLKTTEFPDDIPYLMIAFGIFIWYIYALTFGDFFPLLLSLVTGTVVAILGWIAYRKGVWGDGDSAILAAIVFLIPSATFLIGFVFNLLVVSIFYLIAYALFIGLRGNISTDFIESVKNTKIAIISYIIIIPIILFAINVLSPQMLFTIAILLVLGLLMLFFVIYAKCIEKKLFRKKIQSKDLKSGDVLASSKQWIGLTEEQVIKIKKTQKYVEIKDGVRFTIAFPIAIAVTYFLGNILMMIILV